MIVYLLGDLLIVQELRKKEHHCGHVATDMTAFWSEYGSSTIVNWNNNLFYLSC